ncbi:MAG: signal peptide peptidase SppA [Verrucomicrobiae bacterium]|nr:signal peptide peptidase SppA [Verrucomicrobiae bacterium]
MPASPPPPPPRSSKGSCLLGAVIGAAVTVIGGIILFIILGLLGAAFSGGQMEHLGPGPKIAHIDLEGIITGVADFGFGASGQSMVDEIKEELKQAVENEEVKAIVLRINSPGGEVTASDTIYEAIRQANEKKPIVVYMDSMAASGGYYAACGASEIFANDTTMTGSIGVIISTLNYRELFGKVGLESQVFKSGQFKDLLSGSRETSPEEAALIQGMVMETYDKFVGIVSEARAIPEAKLRDGIADGRIFSGAKAKEIGLVNETGYIEDAYDRARELGKAPEAEVMKIHTAPTLLEALTMAKSNAAAGTRVEIDLSDRLLPRLQPGMVYLLPSTWGQ